MQFFAGLSLFIFIFAAVLLILLVLIQNDQGEGLGGLFSGSSTSLFGGQGANVLQKITGILALLFFAGAISYSLTAKTGYTLLREIDASFNEEAAQSPWWTDEKNLPAESTTANEEIIEKNTPANKTNPENN